MDSYYHKQQEHVAGWILTIIYYENNDIKNDIADYRVADSSREECLSVDSYSVS